VAALFKSTPAPVLAAKAPADAPTTANNASAEGG
jgi:hypothetical protein